MNLIAAGPPGTILCVTRIISSPADLRGWSGRGPSVLRRADLSSGAAWPPDPRATFSRLVPSPGLPSELAWRQELTELGETLGKTLAGWTPLHVSAPGH